MASELKAAAIIPAGGSGSRLGLSLPKQFVPLEGKPLIVHTLDVFQHTPLITTIVLVVPQEHLDRARKIVERFGFSKVRHIVPGGRERQDSVAAGLAILPDDIDVVAVHDGARPFVSRELVEKCLTEAARHGAAMAAVQVKDTLKEVSGGTVRRTVDRASLWQAQTPQAARLSLLRKAFKKAGNDSFQGTDEASLLEHAGIEVQVVQGDDSNLKITRVSDLDLAEAWLTLKRDTIMTNMHFRIGHGYDAHRLVSDRPLILGGVKIPFEKGLLGHSDADTLTHAICDAILGALGAGDIGSHFPDSDDSYRGISSLKLLDQVVSLAEKKGFAVGNIDATVIAQRPRLASYFSVMRGNLAPICRISPERINLKGTTTEQMGFAGRGEGIAAHAVVMLSSRRG
jgi:2-C-methyl-D-erythritol 4-phosphate cytidylyltransferase/2-C-methyl-D-erythritol 2,4-cyclodiphosphate synthase